MRRRHCVALLSLAGAISLAGSRQSSAEEALSPWIRLSVVDVIPGRVDDFVAAQRELTARASKAGVSWRSVSRTEVFGNTYRFLVATPVAKLASFDAPGDAARDPERTAIIRRIESCITSRTSYAVRTLAGLSSPLPEGESPRLALVNLVRIAPGREQDYIDVMAADFLPHFEEAGVHHVTGSIAFGGESGFLHVFYVKDFAELDKGSPVMRALGADGAEAATAKLSGIVTSSELWVTRVLPELSYSKPPSETDTP